MSPLRNSGEAGMELRRPRECRMEYSMSRSAAAWATACMVLSSCHPPSDESNYASAKSCHAVFEASLKIVDVSRLPKTAKFDPVQTRLYADDLLDTALDFGEQMGMRPVAIRRDLDQALAAYLRSYSDTKEMPDQKTARLFADLTRCQKVIYPD
jgi:hypothetical protein